MQLRNAISLALAAAAGLAASGNAFAHGTMSKPASRVYACYQGNPENPTNPACAAAKEVGGSQPFYDWNAIAHGNANGNHQGLVKDGELCSASLPKYRGLDLNRADWQTTPMRADVRGRYTFEFLAPAPHQTREWKFYVTREGWQPGSRLAWSDLEEFCTLGNVPLSEGGVYKLDCPLPQRSGQHVIYNTWQRSDSAEAFYTCMDVRFEGGGGVTPPPQWQDAGPVTARGALDVGTSLALRVFNAQGNDLESVETTLVAGQTAPAQWPLVLARKVNATAQHARVGVLSNGVVTPVASATENRVYLKPGNRFQLETQVPLPSPDPVDPPPGGDFDHVYPAGIGSYKPGETVVKGTDGKLYACRPFPEGAWCNINADAYRPGTGWAWRDAWIAY
ncbi:cellulose-binding protein [Stenotrophomonas maltophilia]|uniref:lytic polysaccharide monooxygenase n=1 Tax=Stenotrophomonas geniculata TaxID=86188 RepID=UPI0013130384|nr:lytic polysaccharide monooxygenase [Stenotrophomonas geniculata]QHE21324.1 cellulose-binding protein [Stenotrophomonas maltophilia]